MVYQIWMNIAIFLSSWGALIKYPLYLEPWAILSAALWVTASILSIFAVNNIGMSIAAGIWCGVSMVTSFLWGAIVFEKEHPVKSLPLAIVSLGILILGTSIISLANRPTVARLLSKLGPCNNCASSDRLAQGEDESKDPLLTLHTVESINSNLSEIDDKVQPPSGRPWVGVLCAILTGYGHIGNFSPTVHKDLSLIQICLN
jgi:multidrug transporter EmrE-like cation transporter